MIRRQLSRPQALELVGFWVHEQIQQEDRERFREVVESELLAIHAGNFARYRVTPAEFKAWLEVW